MWMTATASFCEKHPMNDSKNEFHYSNALLTKEFEEEVLSWFSPLHKERQKSQSDEMTLVLEIEIRRMG